MAAPVGEVTIVGGGTAGWMAAVFLATRLNARPGRPPTRVTLIESPNVPTIGVGEATVPAMREFLRQMRIGEAEFFRRCNASFKLGVRFVNWDVDPKQGAAWYDHPFDGLGIELRGLNPGYHFHRFGAHKGVGAFGDHLSPSTCLIDHRRGPKLESQGEYEYAVGYAYHLDAGLFAGLLKETAIARGVEHVLDDVDAVERDDSGLIAALVLRARGRRTVELVVDCTGFRGLIIQKGLGEPFEGFERQLFNDRALAVQIPHADVTRLEPCTRSTALEAGWSWRVPLHSRIGTGYVFSSAFKRDQEAIDEFLAHLGSAAGKAEPRAIAMRVGRSRRSWVANCVAVGLSGGFIEPLESTAIFIVEQALRWLVADMPDRDFDPARRERFNARMEQLYAEVRDFVALHYVTARRADTPYWRATKAELQAPDALREKLAVWRTRLPRPDDFATTHLFGHWSYLIVLFGKGFFDGLRLSEPAAAERDWNEFCAWVATEKAKLLAHLPDHYRLLSQIRARGTPTAHVGEAAGRNWQPAPMRGTVPLPGEVAGAQIRWTPRPAAAAPTESASLL